MIRGIGIDLVEISRMKAAFDRHGDRLLRRICTPAEIDWIRREKKAAFRLASVFGVKEAVMKALGTGMRGVGWKEIDTSGASEGPVERLLNNRALRVAQRLGVRRYCFSLSVSAELVLAAVLLSGDEHQERNES